MKRQISLFASYCVICAMAMAVATSCKKNDVPPPGPGTGGEPGKEQKDTVARISLFSADSTALAEEFNFEVEAGTQKFIVDAYIKGWKAEITGNEVGATPWITCEPAEGPVGRTEVTIAVTANDIELERDGSITFVQDSTGLTQVVKITQKGLPPMITDITTDSLALVAMYNAFDGKNLFPTKWDPKKRLESWGGVTVSLVDGKRRVTALDFTNSDAKGDIPAELGNLRALTSLTMIVNRVKGVIPNGLSLAKGMKKLYIRGSWGITGLPKDMGLWSDLEVLDIAGTSVAELPASLGKCAKLIELTASPMYEKAKQLIKGDVTKALANKPELLFAIFGKTELTGNISFLKEAPKLTKFETISNKFSGDLNFAENLVNSDSLEYLTLDISPDITGTLAGLKGAKKLSTFRITDSKVGGSLDLAELHLIPKFITLWAPNNEFTGGLSVDFMNGCKTMNNLSMNKLSGTIAPEVQDLMKSRFIFGSRICPQKEGFGFTNCETILPN